MTETMYPLKLAPTLAPALVLGLGIIVGGLVDRLHLTPLQTLAALIQPWHIMIPVRDLEQTASWYEQKLGFTRIDVPDPRSDARDVYLIRDGNLVELTVGTGSARMRGDDVPFFVPQERIAFEIEDIDAEIADLRQKGVSVLEAPRQARTRDLRISLVRDLNGHVLELQETQ